MPIFEYRCDACGAEFELLVRSQREERGVMCRSCGSKHVERRPSVFAAHASTAPHVPLPRAGCGRCGDPNGPCSVG